MAPAGVAAERVTDVTAVMDAAGKAAPFADDGATGDGAAAPAPGATRVETGMLAPAALGVEGPSTRAAVTPVAALGGVGPGGVGETLGMSSGVAAEALLAMPSAMMGVTERMLPRWEMPSSATLSLGEGETGTTTSPGSASRAGSARDLDGNLISAPPAFTADATQPLLASGASGAAAGVDELDCCWPRPRARC